MKFLLTLDSGPAKLYKILLNNALVQLGHSSRIVADNQKILDEFKAFEPDVFFGSRLEYDRAIQKAIERYNPICVLNDDGFDYQDKTQWESKKFFTCGFNNPIKKLKFGHTIPDNFKRPEANVFKSDLLFIGQNKPEKAELFQRYLFPLLYPNTKKLNVKVVGAGFDGLPNAVGVVMDDANVLALQANTKYCLNISNSNYINYRIYQSLALGVPVISSRNPFLEQEIGEDIMFADTAQDIVNIYKDGIKVDWLRPPSMLDRAKEFLEWIN